MALQFRFIGLFRPAKSRARILKLISLSSDLAQQVPCAAIAAVKAGAKVMLFERNSGSGGASSLSGGEIHVGGGGGTDTQRAAGF